MVVLRFSRGVTVPSEKIELACDHALLAIENELPEEAHSYEIYNYVISQCEKLLQEKEIIL